MTVVSPLGFYQDIAEMLYRAGQVDIWLEAEHAIAELARKRIDETPHRATVLIASAGRLYSSDRAASERMWQNAVVAASEIRGAGEGSADALPRPALPEPARVPTRNEAFTQIQEALARTKDSQIRSAVFYAMAGTMIRYMLAEHEPEAKAARMEAALEVVRGMPDEQQRRAFLQQTAQELLDRNEIDGAETLIRELKEEAQTARGDATRSSQLAWLAKVDAGRGHFREARLACKDCLSTDKLWVWSRILWEDAARHDRRIREILLRRDARYSR